MVNEEYFVENVKMDIKEEHVNEIAIRNNVRIESEYFEEDDHIKEEKEQSDSERKKIKFPCNQCDYQATTEGKLKKHIKRRH